MKSTRTLGAAVLAVLALSAAVASTALADEFKSASNPVVFYGVQGAAQSNEWTIDGSNKTTCKTATYESKSLTAPVKTLLLEPTFGGCSALEYTEAQSKLEMNGCQFELLQPGNAPTEGNMAIRCPSGNSIRFFGKNFGTCEALIGEQSNLAKVAYSNTGSNPNKVETKITVTGITVDKKIDGIFCNLNGVGVVTNGTFSATVTLEGKGGIGVSVG